MFNTISEALKNFCTHQVRTTHKLTKEKIDEEVMVAYIDITTVDEKSYRVYVASDLNFLQTVTTIFLEEDNSDDETLKDMLLELTNLIVGSAKVIAENTKDTNFNIATPVFLDKTKFNIDYDDLSTLETQDQKIMVAIKELNE